MSGPSPEEARAALDAALAAYLNQAAAWALGARLVWLKGGKGLSPEMLLRCLDAEEFPEGRRVLRLVQPGMARLMETAEAAGVWAIPDERAPSFSEAES